MVQDMNTACDSISQFLALMHIKMKYIYMRIINIEAMNIYRYAYKVKKMLFNLSVGRSEKQ